MMMMIITIMKMISIIMTNKMSNLNSKIHVIRVWQVYCTPLIGMNVTCGTSFP